MTIGSSCRRSNRVNVSALQSPAPSRFARALLLFAQRCSCTLVHDRYDGRSRYARGTNAIIVPVMVAIRISEPPACAKARASHTVKCAAGLDDMSAERKALAL